MAISRREFVRGAAGLLGLAALGGAFPALLLRSRVAERVAAASGTGGRVLVVVELFGGNDGLNTVIPYQSDVYYRRRPSLAIPQREVLPLEGSVGLHPSLRPLLGWYRDQRLAVIQGVGYPNPNLSHFRSMDVWWSGDPGPERSSGWLGRYLDATAARSSNPLRAISIGSALPKALLAHRVSVPSLEGIGAARFSLPPFEGPAGPWMQAYAALSATHGTEPPYLALVRRSDRTAVQVADTLERVGRGSYVSRVTYPESPLARSLQLVARLVAADLGTEVFYVGMGGFDEHADEKAQHASLLGQYAEAMDAFFRDLTAQGRSDRVLSLTYSEFGRRTAENASGGTDHGAAAPVLVMGGSVRGGLYGQYPSLTDLDPVGDLRYNVDFRAVYSTVVERWLNADPAPAVGRRWPAVGFV
jgi:uncharacterized protein (DUF1501 family)